jgi:hypothetical protein
VRSGEWEGIGGSGEEKEERTHEIPHVAVPVHHAHALLERHMRMGGSRVQREHVVEAGLVEIACLRESSRVGAMEGLVGNPKKRTRATLNESNGMTDILTFWIPAIWIRKKGSGRRVTPVNHLCITKETR